MSSRSQAAESLHYYAGSIHLKNNDTVGREEENESLTLIYDPNHRNKGERSKNEYIHSISSNTMMDAIEMESIEPIKVKEKRE